RRLFVAVAPAGKQPRVGKPGTAAPSGAIGAFHAVARSVEPSARGSRCPGVRLRSNGCRRVEFTPPGAVEPRGRIVTRSGYFLLILLRRGETQATRLADYFPVTPRWMSRSARVAHCAARLGIPRTGGCCSWTSPANVLRYQVPPDPARHEEVNSPCPFGAGERSTLLVPSPVDHKARIAS